MVQRTQVGRRTHLRTSPPGGTVTPRLVTLSWISMMSREHREITQATKHPDHTVSTQACPTDTKDRLHQCGAAAWVQRQLVGQIHACLRPSWKILRRCLSQKSNIQFLTEAGAAAWCFILHQIKQLLVSGRNHVLNPRCSLGTIQSKRNHSSQRPLRDGQANPHPQFPEAFLRDVHSTTLYHPGSLFQPCPI